MNRLFHLLFAAAILFLAAWYFLASPSSPPPSQAPSAVLPATPPSPLPPSDPPPEPVSNAPRNDIPDDSGSPAEDSPPSPLDTLSPPEDEEVLRTLMEEAERHGDPQRRRAALDRLSPSFLRQPAYDPLLLSLFQNAARNDPAAVVRKSALRTLCRLSDDLSWEIVRRACESDPDLNGWMQTHLRNLHEAGAYAEGLRTWATRSLAGSDFEDIAELRIKSLPPASSRTPSDPPLPKR